MSDLPTAKDAAQILLGKADNVDCTGERHTGNRLRTPEQDHELKKLLEAKNDSSKK